MKKVLLISLGVVVLMLGILSTAGLSWVADERLIEIEERIRDTELRLLQLDENQLFNRLEWTDRGIDLLNRDIKEGEKEIAQDRERWDELRRGSYDSERAWAEWERVGRKLDELEWRKRRLHRVLDRLKRLRYRLGVRSRELKRISEPGPFRLGLGFGYLVMQDTSNLVSEIRLRVYDKVDFFYGQDYKEIEEDIRYYGAEVLLLRYQSESFRLRFPVGVKFSENGITPCIGMIVESQWQNYRGETTGGFLQVRLGLGTVTLLIGLLF